MLVPYMYSRFDDIAPSPVTTNVTTTVIAIATKHTHTSEHCVPFGIATIVNVVSYRDIINDICPRLVCTVRTNNKIYTTCTIISLIKTGSFVLM